MSALNASASFELSVNQKEWWIRHDDCNKYYCQIIISVDGHCDTEELTASIMAIVKRHHVLFSKCSTLPESQFPLQTSLTAPGGIGDLDAPLDRPFDPFTDMPVRFHLNRIADDKYLLTVRLYALWGDSFSCVLIYKELRFLYGDTQRSYDTTDMIEYRNFSQWQNDLLKDPDEEAVNFWGKYNHFFKKNIIPFESNCGSLFSPGKHIIASFEKQGLATLNNICEELNTNASDLLLSIFCLYLSSYSENKITVGYTPFKRSYKELDATVGLVNRMLPFTFDGKETKNIKDAVSYVGKLTDELMTWGDYLVLDKADEASRTSFDCCFEYVDLRDEINCGLSHPSFKVNDIQSVSQPFTIQLYCVRYDDHLDLDLYFDENKFNLPQIDIIFSQLKQWFSTQNIQLVNETGAGLSDKDQEVIGASYATTHGSATDKTIPALFEAQTARTPGDIAVIFGGNRLSYRELNEKSNRLAHYLQQKYGVMENQLVGIKLARSEWMPVAILGVLKSGAAYVPIDTEYPPDRVAWMVSDSQCKVVIDQQALLEFSEVENECPVSDFPPVARPDDLAYVIYTSGSTGRPKGVMITHRSLVDYVYGILSVTDIKECKSFGLVSSVAADLGNTVFYPSLVTGGELHIFSEADVTDPEKMLGMSVDCLKIVPSHWKSLRIGNKVPLPDKCLFFGGEQLTEDVLALIKLNKGTCKVYNHYGPSETTIGKLLKYIDPDAAEGIIPLGTPFGNTRVYVLDENLRMVPVGVPGEICIGGEGLAKGYRNQQELTAEKFVPDPFCAGERIYRTGDLARWLPDGNIGFIGRKDDQVKIRGYRIEPAEIEATLRRHPGIDSAAVMVSPDKNGEKRLIAYIVSKAKLSAQDAEAYLGKTLPVYMLPSKYILLDKLPLTPNGKIDRKKLPAPEEPGIGTEIPYWAPGSLTERTLALIWQEVLGVEKVGLKDDFFALGGHSLKAIRLASRIYKDFEIKIRLKDLFETTLLGEQARLIGQAIGTPFETIPLVVPQPGYVLSSSQQRLWILCQSEEGNIAYNMPATLLLEGNLDLSALTHSFTVLIERHESLRTVFEETGLGEIRQFILPPEDTGFAICCRDLRSEDRQQELIKDLVRKDAARPFDLHTGPLLRASLYQIADHRWIFVYIMHHIISDGWSMGVLIKELLLYYNTCIRQGSGLVTPLGIQYKDYAAWQQEQLMTTALQMQKKYWLTQFEGELPILELPANHTRPVIKSYKGSVINRTIGSSLAKGIKTISHGQDATLFMGLLAVVNVLLYKYTGQKDIIIGTPIAGREHADLEGQIGLFVNTMALRTRFNDEEGFNTLLENVRQIMVDAYERQAYPFDELIRELHLHRDMSRHPLFDVMVLLQNTDNHNIGWGKQLDELTISLYEEEGHVVSKFDLLFAFTEQEEELNVYIEYNNELYEEPFITQLLNHLESLLTAIIEAPSMPITQLDYLSQPEKNRQLIEFNDTQALYSDNTTIVDLFEIQVARLPDHVALVYDETSLTYTELNRRVNRLGNYLRNTYGIRADDLIGIRLERSEWMIIAMLAVLKSGGAYVPMDPEYPKDRIDYMVTDSGCRAVIDDLELERFWANGKEYSSENLKPVNKSTDLLYVMYTSGSTGKPKGCMLEHRGLINRMEWMWKQYGFTQNDNILQKTSFTFDVSVWEIFMPLCWGAKMVLCQKEDVSSPERILSLIEKQKVTGLHFIPGMLHSFIAALWELEGLKDRLKTVQRVMTSGEALSPATVCSWYDKVDIPIHNLYGPTEASIEVAHYATSRQDTKIPIGRPIWNTQLYILGPGEQLMPLGALGEICIAGDGLSRGYLNNADLTAEKFVQNPFVEGKKIYKTGDVGRWLQDGNIEFIGRKDEQVKIRGFRIELAEIEYALQAHPDIDSSVVLVRPGSEGEKQLIAYLISRKTLNTPDVRAWLSMALPTYMIPNQFVQVSSWPLTSSGKIDKKQLQESSGPMLPLGVEYIAARNEIEAALLSIWQQTLGIEKIGMKDDFFHLGGYSLKAIQIISRINTVFSVRLNIQNLFNDATIENISGQISFILNQKEQMANRERLVEIDL